MSAVRAVKSKNSTSLTEGKISTQLLMYFFPLLFGSFFQQLYNTIDAVIVGKTLGKVALSSVGGSSGIIVAIFLNFFIGVSNGAAVIISQYYGARNDEEVQKSLHTAIMFSLLAGIFISIVGFLFTPWMLKAMGTPSDVYATSVIYMRIYFLGTIPNYLYNMGSSALRATGDTRRPLMFLIVSCGANIFLDILFVIVLKMGVAGAALATVLCQVISALLVLAVLIRARGALSLRFSMLRIDGYLLKKIIRIGLPSGVQSLMYTGSNVLVQVSINSFGTNTVAAWTAYEKVDMIFWMLLNSFGTSIMTFVGQNYGAGKKERVRRGVNICLLMTVIMTVVTNLFIYFWGGTVLTIFTSDPDVIQIGTNMIKFLTPTYITFLLVEIYAGALRGMGDSFVPMVISVLGVCALRVIWIMGVLPFFHTIYMLMACYPLSWVLSSTAFFIYYHYFLRKKGIVQKK